MSLRETTRMPVTVLVGECANRDKNVVCLSRSVSHDRDKLDSSSSHCGHWHQLELELVAHQYLIRWVCYLPFVLICIRYDERTWARSSPNLLSHSIVHHQARQYLIRWVFPVSSSSSKLPLKSSCKLISGSGFSSILILFYDPISFPVFGVFVFLISNLLTHIYLSNLSLGRYFTCISLVCIWYIESPCSIHSYNFVDPMRESKDVNSCVILLSNIRT
jgi:hypothetical protein